MALVAGGDFLLRIEDIDTTRSRPDWEDMIFDDLHWLGLSWEEPVLRQSDRMDAYASALEHLWPAYLFACTCTRRDIKDALSAPQEGVIGPDGPVYPGTCRTKADLLGLETPPRDTALRLRSQAIRNAPVFAPRAGEGLIAGFEETGHGPNGEHGLIEFSEQDFRRNIGDVVLARRDFGTSYHLSVTLDDADQGITHVVRGEDLFEATKIHVVLQSLLGLPKPTYHHHKLIRDDAGKRLAKRDDARAIRTYREDGASPADIRRMVGL